LLSVLFFFNACGSETEEPVIDNFGISYFPLVQGKEYIYESDSILYSNGGTNRDTFKSFIKEVIGDTIHTLDGKTEYFIQRYFKRNFNDEWSAPRRWTAYKDDTNFIRTEENLKFIKLNLPLTTNKRWNANVFFDENQKVSVGVEQLVMYPGWRSIVKNIAKKIKVFDKEYETIDMELVDESSAIERRFVHEYYAENIGLVFKEMVILDGDTSRPKDPWLDKGQKGFVHTLRLVSYK
jgi:hypothetical protein